MRGHEWDFSVIASAQSKSEKTPGIAAREARTNKSRAERPAMIPEVRAPRTSFADFDAKVRAAITEGRIQTHRRAAMN